MKHDVPACGPRPTAAGFRHRSPTCCFDCVQRPLPLAVSSCISSCQLLMLECCQRVERVHPVVQLRLQQLQHTAQHNTKSTLTMDAMTSMVFLQQQPHKTCRAWLLHLQCWSQQGSLAGSAHDPSMKAARACLPASALVRSGNRRFGSRGAAQPARLAADPCRQQQRAAWQSAPWWSAGRWGQRRPANSNNDSMRRQQPLECVALRLACSAMML